MAEKKINGVLKQVLELGPTLIFFLVYMRLKDQTYYLGGTQYSASSWPRWCSFPSFSPRSRRCGG